MKNEKRLIYFFIFVAIVSNLFVSIFMVYGDTLALINTSRLFHGSLKNNIEAFYDFDLYIGIFGAQNANWLCRLPVLIWYLPGIVISKIFGIDFIGGYFGLIWHKIGLYVVFAFMIKNLCDIAKKYNAEDLCKYIVLMMVSSPSMILSVSFSGQDEIIYITMFLYAIKCYLNNDKVRFTIFSYFSIICCPIMVLPYVIVLISYEKNIVKIIGKFCIPFIPQFLYSIYYSKCISYKFADRENNVSWLFGGAGIRIGGEGFSIVAFILVMILIASYFGEKSEEQKNGVFLMSIAMMTLEIFGVDQFYRKIIWIPFAVVLVCAMVNEKEISLLLVFLMDVMQSILFFTKKTLFNVTIGWNQVGRRLFGEEIIRKDALLKTENDVLSTLLISAMVALGLALILQSKKYVKYKIEKNVFVSCMLLLSMSFPVLLAASYLYAF